MGWTVTNGRDAAAGESGTVYCLDPDKDLRWKEFVCRHPRSSIYHSAGWRAALLRTYGFETVVYTTTPSGLPLQNGLLFCRVKSRLTGRRLVSLPFSDHCEPLVDNPEDLEMLLNSISQEAIRDHWKYVELRPRTPDLGFPPDFAVDQEYWQHVVDLRPNLDQLFRNMSKDSVQRKIRRAERDGLVCQEGRSEFLLDKFFRLMLLTRRRHELPPPPLEWYRNLINCLGEKLTIRVALKDERPVASLLLLTFHQTVVYKYGCSDAGFHNLGGMPFLLWKTIEDAKAKGAQELDLGRTDMDNAGLIQFKERLGATGSKLCYRRFPPTRALSKSPSWKMQAAKTIFSRLPDRFLVAAGKFLYPHMG